MSSLALVSTFFGAIIILSRGPIIFAPEASRKFIIDSIFCSNTRIRIIGVFVFVLGTVMINVARGYDLTAALIIKCFGWYLVVSAFLILLVFTSIYKDIVINIMGNMDRLILRIIGVLSVGIGAVFIYLGIAVF